MYIKLDEQKKQRRMRGFKLNFEIGRLTGPAKVCVKRRRV